LQLVLPSDIGAQVLAHSVHAAALAAPCRRGHPARPASQRRRSYTQSAAARRCRCCRRPLQTPAPPGNRSPLWGLVSYVSEQSPARSAGGAAAHRVHEFLAVLFSTLALSRGHGRAGTAAHTQAPEPSLSCVHGRATHVAGQSVFRDPPFEESREHAPAVYASDLPALEQGEADWPCALPAAAAITARWLSHILLRACAGAGQPLHVMDAPVRGLR